MRSLSAVVCCAAFACGCGDSAGAEADASGSSADASSSSDTTAASSVSTSGSGSSDAESGSTGSTGGGGAVVWLQNDGWAPPDAVTWQAWPSPNDCWAASYEIDDALYPFDVVRAEAAIGGGPGVRTFELAVWSVDSGNQPVEAIDSATVDIDGDVGDTTVVDVSAMLDVPPITEGGFALVMCHLDHMGAPTIGTDVDGTVDANNNWVFQDLMGEWVAAPDFFGIDGDFILRAGVETKE